MGYVCDESAQKLRLVISLSHAFAMSRPGCDPQLTFDDRAHNTTDLRVSARGPLGCEYRGRDSNPRPSGYEPDLGCSDGTGWWCRLPGNAGDSGDRRFVRLVGYRVVRAGSFDICLTRDRSPARFRWRVARRAIGPHRRAWRTGWARSEFKILFQRSPRTGEQRLPVGRQARRPVSRQEVPPRERRLKHVRVLRNRRSRSPGKPAGRGPEPGSRRHPSLTPDG